MKWLDWRKEIEMFRSLYLKAVRAVSRFCALIWPRIYKARYRVLIWRNKHGALAIWLLIIILICASVYLSPFLQRILESHLSNQNGLSSLKSLFLSLGSALIAAAVIAFSLIMFAMQVNVERTPHGLFRKLSEDKRIMTSFAGTFLLAICIACISLIPDVSWVAAATLGSAWGTFLIFMLFLYAYRRALILINPLTQLNIVIRDARREMQAWVRRAKRAAPLLQAAERDADVEAGPHDETHDWPLTTYFQANPHWTDGAKKATQHAISLARRYAEQGDHEVSSHALRAVVVINRNYVQMKGKTFFADSPLNENPLSTDGFINNTLELLRQNANIGISRKDEQQIEQTLRAFAELVRVYIGIDYSNEYASKTHAFIASGYLTHTLQAVIPHDMADVLMEGVLLMGQSADIFLEHTESESIATLIDDISLLAVTGLSYEKYRPVTLTAIEQLANLTFKLIRTNRHDIHFAIKRLREKIASVTKLFLQVPDSQSLSIHSRYLAPYYSITSTQSLLTSLADLGNALAEVEPENKDARNIIHNIETWAEGLYQPQKEILLLAVEKQSGFTFDMLHGIAYISKLLLALSNTPASDARITDELRKHALWLIFAYSWIPDDEEAVTFVENYELTEILFEVAIDAYQRDCLDIFREVQKLLIQWAFKAGKYQNGYAIMERALCGLATLVLIENSMNGETLKRQIAERLTQPDAPSQKIRNRVALAIKRRAQKYHAGHEASRIESEMFRRDPAKMETLLKELSGILSGK